MQPLKIAGIQTDLAWEDKSANLDMLAEKIKTAAESASLVILPEMFPTGFSMQPEKFAEEMSGEIVSWMKQQSALNRIALTGSIPAQEDGKYYNRLLWILPDGSFGYYDKRHLFGFAKEEEHFSAGNRRLIAKINGWRINLQVCYDLRFPIWSRQANTEGGEPEYDVLIYVANWPAKRSRAWKTLLCARAIENQCYVIGVNRVGTDGNGFYHSGDSMVIDPLGEVLYHLSDEEAIFSATLDYEMLAETRKKFPFLNDRDKFSIS